MADAPTLHEADARRVAVIADSGFYVGPALSRALAARGHDLVLGDPADGLADELEATGVAVEVVTGVRDLADPRAVSREEAGRREVAAVAADARVKAARAYWEQARADLAAVRTQRDRMTVRAPIAGEVLQVNLRAGEFAAAGGPQPLLIMGETRTLHVRVDIDEADAWRVAAGAAAVAYVRGSNELSTPATFVRFEPLVVPRRSLSGSSIERVDTRVLQVVFAFPRDNLPVYVGQQLDVMIEAKPARGAGSGPGPGNA